jgi:hypothetical protein
VTKEICSDLTNKACERDRHAAAVLCVSKHPRVRREGDIVDVIWFVKDGDTTAIVGSPKLHCAGRIRRAVNGNNEQSGRSERHSRKLEVGRHGQSSHERSIGNAPDFHRPPVWTGPGDDIPSGENSIETISMFSIFRIKEPSAALRNFTPKMSLLPIKWPSGEKSESSTSGGSSVSGSSFVKVAIDARMHR